MHANDVTPGVVRRLAGLRGRKGRVLSLYLDLDPREIDTPQARSAAVSSLLHDARAQVEAHTEADHDARTGLREDIEALEELLAPDTLTTDGARGLAVFIDSPDDVLEVLRLPRPVPSRATVGEVADVEPLVAFRDQERWCVALVNRSLARFLVGPADTMVEVSSFEDDPHSRHDQGGGERGEGASEKQVHDHHVRVSEALAQGRRRNRFDRLLLACPQEQRAAIEEALHPDVRERLAGHLVLDVSDVTPDEVREAVRDVTVEFSARYLEDRLARFAELRAQDARAAGGLDEVLVVLVERRVETLFVHDDFVRPGLRDPDTGWLGIKGQRPPTEGRIEQLEDITPAAIDLAIQQDAEVLTIAASEHHELEREDGIGAILRFDR